MFPDFCLFWLVACKSLHLWNSLPDALFPEHKEYQKASIIILIAGYLKQTAGDINYEKTYKLVSDEK